MIIRGGEGCLRGAANAEKLRPSKTNSKRALNVCKMNYTRRNKSKKNTLPSAAVMIPIGISWPVNAVRAMTSTQTRKHPPTKPLAISKW